MPGEVIDFDLLFEQMSQHAHDPGLLVSDICKAIAYLAREPENTKLDTEGLAVITGDNLEDVLASVDEALEVAGGATLTTEAGETGAEDDTPFVLVNLDPGDAGSTQLVSVSIIGKAEDNTERASFIHKILTWVDDEGGAHIEGDVLTVFAVVSEGIEVEAEWSVVGAMLKLTITSDPEKAMIWNAWYSIEEITAAP